MANEDLAHWIVQKRNEKFSDEQIRSYLLKYNYGHEAVDQAFEFIKSHDKKEMNMGLPPSPGGVNISGKYYDLMAILSLLSIFIFPIVSIPLSIISLKHLKKNPHLKGKWMAVTGLICGLFWIIILILLFVLGFISAMNQINTANAGQTTILSGETGGNYRSPMPITNLRQSDLQQPQQKARILHRITRDCATNNSIDILEGAVDNRVGITLDPVNDETIIDLYSFQNGGYTNYLCEPRYQTQCIQDGTFDSWQDEWCEY